MEVQMSSPTIPFTCVNHASASLVQPFLGSRGTRPPNDFRNLGLIIYEVLAFSDHKKIRKKSSDADVEIGMMK